ncbi:MAG: glycosyl hydrolase family 18 protein [Clostridia bacterium]
MRILSKIEKVLIIYSSICFLVLTALIISLCVNPQPMQDIGMKSYKKSGFPRKLVAPFIDLTSWVPLEHPYSVNGVPNLSKIAGETGEKYFNLGFVQLDYKKPINADGSLRWCWAGYYYLSEKGNDNFQYEGIKACIKAVRDQGGDVIVSIGGQLGPAPWTVSANVLKLADMYTDIVNTYKLKRIDLDIEEGKEDNQINAKAIKIAQTRTNVEVVLTIPVMPNGWDKKQIDLIESYLNEGVDICLINNMTMCYGFTSLNANEDYGDASIRAMANAAKQLVNIYKTRGKTISISEAYKKMGATVDIGYENNLNPTFTPNLTKKVVDDAIKNNYGMVSFWSLNRDTEIEENKGITSKYAHLYELKKFAN